MAIAITETEYISSKELKELHGFTDPSIKKFLGECDMTQSNPKSKSAAPIRLYSIERVNAVLADRAFIEWQSKKQSSTSKQKQAVANIEVVSKTEAIATRQAPQIEAFDFDGGLSDLKTADWVDFQWEYFRDEHENKFSEEQKLHAVITVKKMLAASYWFAPEVFFNAFSQYGKGGADSPDLVSTYKSSILTNGWRGIPLVSLMICDRKDPTKMMLDSGHHRWTALKELWEAKELPNDFKIPVFDLKQLRPIVRDQYNPSLEFALRYAVTGGTLGHDFALRVIAKNWFTRLCTGVDCSY
ncbi:hypothetical protein APA_3000 [Pseudanabaena sp. lw0831]|uniref:hypothetical protein n=1 Tax=Pseudanabaena sp. lw0831 TaxID=1357935 RepID=UPI0019163A30|nr:hypothetical protein [Pseudanabaena sp. lw0831]GBO54949.1 hypothetical protein APA_3000 [Pseudanabaena sp. lw0831]